MRPARRRARVKRMKTEPVIDISHANMDEYFRLVDETAASLSVGDIFFTLDRSGPLRWMAEVYEVRSMGQDERWINHIGKASSLTPRRAISKARYRGEYLKMLRGDYLVTPSFPRVVPPRPRKAER